MDEPGRSQAERNGSRAAACTQISQSQPVRLHPRRRDPVRVWSSAAASRYENPRARANDHAYPDKSIRVIVGFSAGGAVDLAPRIIGEKLTEIWNQPVVTENRPGAGGGIAAQMVAKAAPDGYTLLSVSAAHVILPALSATDLYDLKDFTGVTTTISVPAVLVSWRWQRRNLAN